jgi:hypothetical protein
MTTGTLTPADLKLYAKHQKSCLVCGNGMIVTPWGTEVAEFDRVDILADGKQFPIHRYCLDEGIRERLGRVLS